MRGGEPYSSGRAPDPLPVESELGRSEKVWGMGFDRFFPCVRLRGLPFTVLEDDIRMFLGGQPVDVLVVKRDGRATGDAFVVYGCGDDIDLALLKNKCYMGRRYVEVFRAKKLDYYKAILGEMTDTGPISTNVVETGRRRRGLFAADPPPQLTPRGAPTVLRLRGLPFSVTREDITNWFNDGTLAIDAVNTENVHLVMDYGRPSGVAFVEFSSQEECQQALSKDRQMMGTRYIEIFQSTKDELARIVYPYRSLSCANSCWYEPRTYSRYPRDSEPFAVRHETRKSR